ncbi:MAG: hypothetical protein M3451_06085 [Chloroflexota bacterium]|nr:hypothetical protein [Chloroflexota bacterium]
MRSVASWLLAFSIPIGLILCGQATAKDSSLTVGIKTDCLQYGIQDRITVNVALKNQSRSPIVLYGDLGWGALGGLTLRVSRMDGERVDHDKLDHDMIVPSTLQEHEYYSTLFRNQFIGTSRIEQVQELFPGPGKYKVWAEYLSPVPIGSSLIKDKFWSMEKGMIASSAVVLSITQGSACKKSDQRGRSK